MTRFLALSFFFCELLEDIGASSGKGVVSYIDCGLYNCLGVTQLLGCTIVLVAGKSLEHPATSLLGLVPCGVLVSLCAF